ncbi:MAG: SDR family oxidoreductase [Actinomycetia bacterium]|nr:SDR family oxidoreductase [Actinomycetes bacterium]MCP4084487.1 SDR family oxidoreductase [Actinomycetes bacterium]
MTDRPVALLTVADWYVGPALAHKLAPTHDLVLHLASGDEAPAELADLPTEIITVTGDVATAEGNQAVVNAALQRFGRIDAASLLTGEIIIGPFLDATTDQWEKVKRANLDMVFHGLQAVLPPMIEAGVGQIVVFTSATGARPEPGVSLYGSTRAGANAMVRAVGLEHAKAGVCVNAIGTNYMDFPGFIKASGADDPERRKRIEAQVPAGRLGTMDELAEFATVLLDGRSRFQTGQFFSYSGGWST